MKQRSVDERQIAALRRALEDDRQSGECDAEVDALLGVHRTLGLQSASQGAPVDADRVWARIEPFLAPRTTLDKRSRLRVLDRLRALAGALSFGSAALAGVPTRAAAVLAMLLLVAVLGFASKTGTASAQFLRDVDTVARISAAAREQHPLPRAELARLERAATRLSSSVATNPALLDGLPVARIEEAKDKLQLAHGRLAVADAGDAALSVPIATHLVGVIDSLAAELADRGAQAPPSAEISMSGPHLTPVVTESTPEPPPALPMVEQSTPAPVTHTTPIAPALDDGEESAATPSEPFEEPAPVGALMTAPVPAAATAPPPAQPPTVEPTAETGTTSPTDAIQQAQPEPAPAPPPAAGTAPAPEAESAPPSSPGPEPASPSEPEPGSPSAPDPEAAPPSAPEPEPAPPPAPEPPPAGGGGGRGG